MEKYVKNSKGEMFPEATWKKLPEERQAIWRDFFTQAVMGATAGPSAKPITIKSSQLISHEGAPDLERVNHYLNKILKGEKFEPLKIIREGAKYGIEDGKHRFEALKALGVEDIPVQLVGKAKKATNFVQDKLTGKMKGSQSPSSVPNWKRKRLKVDNN